MEWSLDPVEIRVLGCLIEKQITTPEYYPLTLNALINACNQTTNRDPVTAYGESTITRALETLRDKGLVWEVRGSRAAKFEHRFRDQLPLAPPEVAAMCVLMLRGPQTAGEIRARAGRLHEFASLEEVDRTLEALKSREPPLVTKLPRSPGTKEPRFAHLIGSEAPGGENEARQETPSTTDPGDQPRITRVEEAVEGLRQELQELRQQFQELKRQFE